MEPDKSTSIEMEIKKCCEQNQNIIQSFFTQILNKLNDMQLNNQNEINSLKDKIDIIDQKSEDIKQLSIKNQNKIKSVEEQINDLKRQVTSGFNNTEVLIKAGNKTINEIKRCVPTINLINDQVTINHQDILTIKSELDTKFNTLNSSTNNSSSQNKADMTKMQSTLDNLSKSLTSDQNSKNDRDQYILNYMILRNTLPHKFVFNKTSSYNGILRYLNIQFGNPFENQIIEISTQRPSRTNITLKNLGNLDNTVMCRAKYIQFDFKGFQYCYKAFEIEDKTKSDDNVSKKYILEGSHHGTTWQQIKKFTCSYTSFSLNSNESPYNFYRYFRIRLEDDSQFIKLNKIELYGILENRQINPNKRVIKILCVTLQNRPTIDYSFIDYLNQDINNADFFIHYTVVYDTSFKFKLERDQNYLNLFDIVVLGGCNEFGTFSSGFTPYVVNSLKKFHNENGILLFLHDVSWNKLLNSFSPFLGLLGFIRNNPTPFTAAYRDYNSVVFNSKSGKSDLMRNFFVQSIFDIDNFFLVKIWKSHFFFILLYHFIKRRKRFILEHMIKKYFYFIIINELCTLFFHHVLHNYKYKYKRTKYQNLPVSDIQLFLQKVTLEELNGPIWAQFSNFIQNVSMY